MASFGDIVRDIKDIKIQGATNVALAAAKAMEIAAHEAKGRSKQEIIHQLNHARQILFRSRPTEPAMRNAVNYLVARLDPSEEPDKEIKKRLDFVRRHFEEAKEIVAKIGAKKIGQGDVIFTHCHSSFVIDILKKAKKEGKRIKLYNTETRPLFQGRITAREAARAGIPVRHFVDSAARAALKEADIMLIGADAISSEGKVVNKIGSEMFAEIADKYDVPVYVCTDSWKFDPQSVFGYEEEIEKRPEKEVWPTAPDGVMIDNKAFEKIDSDIVTGVISELGVYKPEVFIEEVKRAYPWIF